MSQTLSRRLVPFSFRSSIPQLPHRTASSSAKAGKAASSKPRTLEKPDKFRPPSHPQRLSKKAPIRQYGPDLTQAERTAQSKKQYPNMMPPEGSFMHWFLTNRAIHAGIALTVLLGCGLMSIGMNFKQNSPYYDMLPSLGQYVFHPFNSIRQFLHVYHLHVEYTTMKTAEKRRLEVEEAMKRRAYRIAHGLEKADDAGITATSLPGVPGLEPTVPEVQAALGADGQAKVDEQPQEEVKGPRRYKKWFGIW